MVKEKFTILLMMLIEWLEPANFPDEAPGTGMRIIKLTILNWLLLIYKGVHLCKILMIHLKRLTS